MVDIEKNACTDTNHFLSETDQKMNDMSSSDLLKNSGCNIQTDCRIYNTECGTSNLTFDSTYIEENSEQSSKLYVFRLA